MRNPSIMALPPRAKQIISLHFSVDYAFFHSTTATEKCLWTHPFENRTKLSPFVSRGSNLYRAPQGKIECDDCVTWVSWPSLLGKSRIYTNNVIWVALNLIVYDHSLRILKSVWKCIPSNTATEKFLRTHPLWKLN